MLLCSDGEVRFSLDEDKICRATAQLLLQNAVKFHLREFQEIWQQSVPEGISTKLDQLKVRASTESPKSNQPMVKK